MVQARYNGSSTLASAVTSQALGVTPQSGYAIIVTGKANDNSLINQHNASADAVYSTLVNKRGFLAANVNYLSSTTSTSVSKQQLQDAITTWAKGKLSAAPGPLYLIMIDHGTQSGFMLGSETLTPDDLAGWMNTLETDSGVVASGTTTNYNRVIVIGTCYAGAFISKLSKPGRIIMASAGVGERSIAGFRIYDSTSDSNYYGGEYFVDALFTYLERGDSFKDAFTEARDMVALRDPRKVTSGMHYGVYDTLAQHPLLDDDGDGVAHYALASVGDGTLSDTLQLGVGISSIGNPADITAVTATTSIPASQTSDTPLWLKVSDNSRVAKAWVEIKTPTTVVPTDGATTGQIIPQLLLLPLYYDGLQWNGSYNFPNAGAYNILYYTQDNQTNDISPAAKSMVYKQLSGNPTPPAFNLLTPADGTGQSPMFVLTWQPATVSSVSNLTYTLLVSKSQSFDDASIVYKEEKIPQESTYLPNGALKDPTSKTGAYYCQNGDSYCYWKVQAVDGYGAVTESNIRSFTIVLTNALPSILTGTVTDSNGPIANATVTAGSYTAKTLPNGAYLVMVLPSTYNMSATANNYQQSVVNSVSAATGKSTYVNFQLATIAQPTNGICGASNGQNFTIAPTTDLCSSGSESTVTGSGPWNWSCSGTNGGTTATCQAGLTALDTIPPTLTLSSLANGATTTNPTLNVAGTVSDTGGVKSVTVNGQTVIITNSSFSSAVTLTEGPNTITTIATDNANNAKTDTRTITLDRTAPVMTITLPADNSTTNKSYIELAGTVDDQNATVTAKVNSGTNTTATKNGTNFSATLNLATGQNTIDITATDLAGNSSNAKRTVTSDTTAPTLNITNPVQDTSTALNSITITGTVTDAVSNATISITYEGLTYTPTVTNNSFSQTISLTSDKTYALIITATDQAGNQATAQRNIIKLPKTKIFLEANDTFSISSSGTTLYGNTGNNTVTITTGTTGVTLDQNIGRINLPSTPNSYKFKQTGNIISVYDTTGTTLIVTAPVQGDTDGTQLSFSNGTATASAKLTSGIMTLGTKPVSSGAATTLTPVTTTSTATTPTTTNAKVFLGAENSFTVSSSGITLYGNNGKGIVTITTGMTNITLDQNVGQINLSGAVSSYKFKQTGNIINVYDTTDNLIVKAPVQGDADGTILSFGSQGTASAKLTGGVMMLEGVVVNSSLPSALSPMLR